MANLPSRGTRPAPASHATGATLRRSIGGWSLVALTFNCVVGAGILGLPGRVFALAGPLTWCVLAAAAMLSIAVSLCLAELAGRFDAAGGPVEYCGVAFGEVAGFAVGWLLWTATVLAAASLLNLLAELVAPGHRLIIILFAAPVLTICAMTGAGPSVRVGTALTMVKLVLLLGVAAAGFIIPASPAAVSLGPFDPAKALVLLFFAFVGFERPTAVAGETMEARRVLPIALVMGMVGVTLLYAMLFGACLRSVPDLAGNTEPIATLATRAFGSTGSRAVSGGAALVVVGTLVSQWITAPRLLLAMSDAGALPASLGRLASRRRTPDLAIITTGASAMVLALGGSFVSGIAASSASRLLIFFACAGAVLRLDGANAPRSRFRLPGRKMIAAAVMLACAALLTSAVAELTQLAIIMCVGGFLWLWTIRSRRRLKRSA